MKLKEIEKIVWGEYSFSFDRVLDYFHDPTGQYTISIFEDEEILRKCEINHLRSMNLVEGNLLKTIDGFKFREEQRKDVLADKIANRGWNKCGVKIEYEFRSSGCVEFHTAPLKPEDYNRDEIVKICDALLSISNGDG